MTQSLQLSEQAMSHCMNQRTFCRLRNKLSISNPTKVAGLMPCSVQTSKSFINRILFCQLINGYVLRLNCAFQVKFSVQVLKAAAEYYTLCAYFRCRESGRTSLALVAYVSIQASSNAATLSITRHIDSPWCQLDLKRTISVSCSSPSWNASRQIVLALWVNLPCKRVQKKLHGCNTTTKI